MNPKYKNIPTFKTLVVLIKNGKCIHSELKRRILSQKYYDKDSNFLEAINKLLKLSDEVWLINFEKYQRYNKLNAIYFDNSGVNDEISSLTFNSDKKVNAPNLYKTLKLSEKFNSEITKPFLDNIVWWFDVETYFDEISPIIETAFKEYKKSGVSMIYDYDLNNLVSFQLYNETIFNRKYYKIILEDKITGEHTTYESINPFDIQDIKSSIYKFFEDNNYFDDETIKELFNTKKINDNKIKEAQERHQNLSTWIIDYKDSDGDVGHAWVKAGDKNSAISEFRSDYSNKIIRIYQEK